MCITVLSLLPLKLFITLEIILGDEPSSAAGADSSSKKNDTSVFDSKA